MTRPQHITVLGAGFRALSTVRALRQRDRHARITLVSPRAELHYLPGIIWIPSGGRTRAHARTALLPLIAATTLAGDEDIEGGMAAGMNEYQIKLDRDELMASVRRMMGDEA